MRMRMRVFLLKTGLPIRCGELGCDLSLKKKTKRTVTVHVLLIHILELALNIAARVLLELF